MRKLLATLMVAICVGVTPAAAQVFGVRSFSGTCAVDQPVDVRVDLGVGEQKPNGVIIVEKLPVGWTLSSASPPPSNVNPNSGEVRWVFFGNTVNDEDLDIRYTTAGGDPSTAEIAGDVRFNNSQGAPEIVTIAGAKMCERAVCTGDCDGDRVVTIDEVLQCIGITLSGVIGSPCPACDANGDGTATVDEILTGVNNALNGCR